MSAAAVFAPGMRDAMAEADRLAPLGEAVAAAFWAAGAPDVPVEDLVLPGAAGQPQPARLYRGSPGAAPLLLFVHGGGWVGGSIAGNERLTRTLAARTGWNVLAISYRLAPEHPFPAGLDDCRAALDWLRRPGQGAALAAQGIVLAGTSAGANLALALALEDPRDSLAGLLLFYGVYSDRFDTESCRSHASGFGFSLERLRQIFDLYDPGGQHRDDPRLCPLKGDLAGLPPVSLIAAELDVLADDSRALQAALVAAGGASTLHVEPGVTHGFINRGRLVAAGDAALARAATFLTTLTDPRTP